MTIRRWQRSSERVLRTSWLMLCALALLAGGAYAMSQDSEEWGTISAPTLTASVAGHTHRKVVRLSFTDIDPDAGFECSLDGAPPTQCRSPELLRRVLEAGAHRFQVRAIEPASLEVSVFATFTWTVGALAPQIMAHPPSVTSGTSATFVLSDSQPEMRLECRLDGSAWRFCGRQVTYWRLGTGAHRFAARAVCPPGAPSKPVRFRWRVTVPAGAPFSIASGQVPGMLYPGAPPLPIPVTLTNPGDATIFVSSIDVSVSSSPPGCPAATNIVLVQSNASSAQQVVVAPHASVTLPTQGVMAPEIGLTNLPTNQDACRNGAFSLDLTGSAGS